MHHMADPADLSNVEVLVLVVYDLGGMDQSIDTEDVAVRAREVAPNRFSLRKYPDQVDIERVRKRLSDAKKGSEEEALLAGSFEHGWHLTPAGLDWARRNAHLIHIENESVDRVSVDRQTARKLRVEASRFTSLEAWAKYGQGLSVSSREAEAVFRLTPYVSRERRKQIIDSTRNLFRSDEEFGPFVEAMAAAIGETRGES